MAADSPYSLDAIFHALSDPTRRAVVDRLRHGGGRVTDLAAPFDLALSSFSRHLKVLEQAGVVRRLREGREHVFQLVPEALQAVGAWTIEGMGPPAQPSGHEGGWLPGARALAHELAPRMAAVRMALVDGEGDPETLAPDAFMARRLRLRVQAHPALAADLARGLGLYDQLKAEIASAEQGGPGPGLETLGALGSLAYDWDTEPAFQNVWLGAAEPGA